MNTFGLQLLRKSHEHVWPAAGAKDSNYQYSLVDGSGTSTGHSDFNTDLHVPDGGKETFAQRKDHLHVYTVYYITLYHRYYTA